MGRFLRAPPSAASSSSDSDTDARREAPKRRTKQATPVPRVLSITLTIGDWLDVLDFVGVWNVAQVLSIPSPNAVEVRYDGWDTKYNEVVPLNSERVAPFHTYTWSVKCWAKYKNWPWWPAVVTVRTPGTAAGRENLRRVKNLYVDFLDNKNFVDRCRLSSWVPPWLLDRGPPRCWINKRDVVPFEDNFGLLRKRTTGADFERSLQRVLKAAAMVKFPTFVRGTLPQQYAASVTVPVKKMKKTTGNTMWLKDFANNRARHDRMYGHEGDAATGDQDGADEVTALLKLQERLARALRDEKKRGLQTPTRSPKAPPPPRSPRVAAPPPLVASPGIPNVIVNNDDLIVVDDDDDDDEDAAAGDDERSVTRRWKRTRRSRSTTPTRTRRKRLVLSSGEEEAKERNEENAADDEDRARVSSPGARGGTVRKNAASAATRATRLDLSSGAEDEDADGEQDDKREERDHGFSPDADASDESDDLDDNAAESTRPRSATRKAARSLKETRIEQAQKELLKQDAKDKKSRTLSPDRCADTMGSSSHEPKKKTTDQDEDSEGSSSDDEDEDRDEVVPRFRRRFCMMRATTRVEAALAAQKKIRALQLEEQDKRLVAALAPNKFAASDPASSESLSEVELPVFGRGGELSHSMLRVADTGVLPLRPSRAGSEDDDDDDDTSSGSPVFSSSTNFSIKSWLQRLT
ncbi:hypothetical protein PybrP1_008879 [[Pythium] brassicae (nom. inval.)]|nr:hypothetical protein PybrP1_008879 [[Pythium] brassicae (nom. inval.)]